HFPNRIARSRRQFGSIDNQHFAGARQLAGGEERARLSLNLGKRVGSLLGEPGQGRSDIRVVLALQLRQQFVPDAVSSETQVGVGAILAERLPDFVEESDNVGPAGKKHWPDQVDAGAKFTPGSDAAQSL